ncbi:MAG: anti-sigma factor family protein [Armatimonadota bacterium]
MPPRNVRKRLGEIMDWKLIKSRGSAQSGVGAVRCEEVQMLLDQYAHGELNPALAEAVSRHLVNCRNCALELETVSAVGTALRYVLSEPPQVDLFPLIAERCRRRDRLFKTPVRLNLGRWVLSGLAVTCVLGFIMLANWQATRTNPMANQPRVKGPAAERLRPHKAAGPSAAVLPSEKTIRSVPTQVPAFGEKPGGQIVKPAHSRQEVLPSKQRSIERPNLLFSSAPKQTPSSLSRLSQTKSSPDATVDEGVSIPASSQSELVLIAETETADLSDVQDRPSFYSVQFPEPAFDTQLVRSLKVYNQNTPEGPVRVVDIDFALPNGTSSKPLTGKRGVP